MKKKAKIIINDKLFTLISGMDINESVNIIHKDLIDIGYTRIEQNGKICDVPNNYICEL